MSPEMCIDLESEANLTTMVGLIEFRQSIIRCFKGFGFAASNIFANSFVAILNWLVTPRNSISCFLSFWSDTTDSIPRKMVPTIVKAGIVHRAKSFNKFRRFFSVLDLNACHVSPWSKYVGISAINETMRKM